MVMIIGLILLKISIIQAQVITSIPPTTGNNRFFDEIHSNMKRPGLSVAGFDDGGNHSKGYGLKQILNQVYVTGSNEQKKLFSDVLGIADDPIKQSPSSLNDFRNNSNRLQYLAFEALASYVLEQNGISKNTSNTNGLNIRSHATAVADLRQD